MPTPLSRRHRRMAFLAVAIATLAVPAFGQTPGRLTMLNAPGVAGDIIAVSPLAVEIESRGELKKIPIEEIREVRFAGEPQSLQAARAAVTKGQAAQALKDLEKIEAAEMDGVAQLVVDELAYVKAAAIGSQAAAGGAGLEDAEQAVRDYLLKHAQSHHAFPMQELLAKVLARSGKFADAAAALAPLDRGPPAYRVRAAAARGGLFYEQGKYDDALREFTAASQVATAPGDAASAVQKRSAQLAASRCLSRQGKGAEAVASIERIVGESAPGDTEILGQAYNALGDACRAAGRDQDAIIAYLTVDLVYNTVAENRAEALFNLAELWERAKYPQRAAEAREELSSTYGESVWAGKAGMGKGS